MVKVVTDGMPESNNVFMTCEDEYSYGPNAFDVIVNTIGKSYEFPNKKVALLGGNITYDMYIQEGVKKAFEAAGWEVVLNDTYAYNNTEFGSQLAKIRAEKTGRHHGSAYFKRFCSSFHEPVPGKPDQFTHLRSVVTCFTGIHQLAW